MQTSVTEVHKSLPIPPPTFRAFRKWVAKHANQQKAAEAVGFKHRNTISSILSKGTCSSESLEKINKVLEPQTPAVSGQGNHRSPFQHGL